MNSGWASGAQKSYTGTFELASDTRLRIEAHYEAMPAWKSLSHHIARNPLDLRAHAQRILVAIDAGLSDVLSGSLQDLFIALDGTGSSFRQRLLDLTSSALSDDDLSFFKGCLRNDDTTKMQQCWRKGSVLSNGTCNDRPLVTREVEQTADYANILEEARACLEYGQIETAQQILEEELLKNPTESEIEEELLNIYHYTRDIGQFGAMSLQLADMGIDFSDAWKKLQVESESWATTE